MKGSSSDNDRYRRKFESFLKKKYTKKDYDTVLDNEETIKKKAVTGALKEYAEYVMLFFSMLKDIVSGKYKEVPVGTIAAIAGTLLYVFSPIDIIPDVIPIMGLTDDAAIVAICISTIAMDIEKYKKWKENAEGINGLFDQ